ncbi:DUF6254 family protein [Paenibacillus hemerocallicola]|jgi:hypothetical protein|nr:DUF6254 family protein [Paenibacillus hemerocallicola]
MTTSKRRKENAWKMRKQNQQPHGKITPLKELSDSSEQG